MLIIKFSIVFDMIGDVDRVQVLKMFQPCTQKLFGLLKGKEHKNANEFCIEVFRKLHTLLQIVWKIVWKSDSYF